MPVRNPDGSRADGKDSLSFVGERLAGSMVTVQHLLEREWGEKFVLKDIRMRPDPQRLGEWLVVIRGIAEGENLVAFHSGYGMVEVLGGALRALLDGKLSWKEDKYVAK